MEEFNNTKLKRENTAKSHEEDGDFFITQTDEASEILEEKLSMTDEGNEMREEGKTSNTFFLSYNNLEDLQE